MADLQVIKKELLSAVQTTDKDILRKVNEELELLEVTEGLENKNNLEAFYDIWKQNRGQTGKDNKVNSWLAYSIGLTNAKPEEGSEPFPTRRVFARAGFPDVDTDFDDEGRDAVQQHLIDKYGRKNVANIGTYMTEKIKGCLRRTTKAVDAAYAFHKGPDECRKANNILAGEISNTLDHVVMPNGAVRWHDSDGNELSLKSIQEVYEHVPDFKTYMDRYPEILKHANVIQGIITTFSVHAAGVVVSGIPLERLAPMRQSKRGLATQWPNEDLESIGLIKFDILAIAQLATIKTTVAYVKDRYGISLDMERLPLDDEVTLSLYRSGNLNGVFQCENGGMQQTMREVGVTSFDDVMATIALYRPGPMDSIPEYVARKKGHKKVDYFHKTIEPHVREILEPTYGVLVYQEQVMLIVSALAGFTVTDGYVMIKAIGKKKSYLMDKFKKQFINGCVDKGVPKQVADQYWDKFITPFASYGFNAAHSCCYAFLSFQTAYLKANYPDEYACAHLNTFSRRAMTKSASSWDQVAMMEKDAQRTMGIKILPRTLNDCNLEWEIEQKKDDALGISQTQIRPSICCKGLGFKPGQNIVENRPYENLEDFAVRTDSSIVTAEELEALIDNGYFKGKAGIKDKENILNKFITIREDLKKGRGKGIKSVDIFS